MKDSFDLIIMLLVIDQYCSCWPSQDILNGRLICGLYCRFSGNGISMCSLKFGLKLEKCFVQVHE